jgi:hypothetical protein
VAPRPQPAANFITCLPPRIPTKDEHASSSGCSNASAVGVEQGVSVVYEAEEHGQSLFQVGERVGMLGMGDPRFLSPRVRMAPVVSSIHATYI